MVQTKLALLGEGEIVVKTKPYPPDSLLSGDGVGPGAVVLVSLLPPAATSVLIPTNAATLSARS